MYLAYGVQSSNKKQSGLTQYRFAHVINVVSSPSFHLSTPLLRYTAAVFNTVVHPSDAQVIQPSLPFMLHTTRLLSVDEAQENMKRVR